MFARQAGYLEIVARAAASALPRGVRRPRRRLGRRTTGAGRGAAAHRARATTTCSPPTSSTTASRVWLIDYEYSGNNDACFELGNTATECGFTAEQTEAWTRGLLRRRRPAPTWRGCGCRRCAASTAGRCGASSRRRPARSTSTSTRWGHGAVRQGRARRSGSPRLRRRCWTRWRRWLSCRPAREVVVVGGGVIGARVAYHLTKLGWTDVLLLEQGHLSGGTTWHAAGLVGPLRASESGHPAGAVLRRALRRARGRDRAGHRLPQRRRGDRRAHRGPDGPAAAHRGQRRGLRPRVRAGRRPSGRRSSGR